MIQQNNNTKVGSSNFTNITQATHQHNSTLTSPLRISTINVRGLRTSNKSQDIIKFINKTNVNILAITETKLTNNIAKYTFKNSQYTHLWTCNDNNYLGSGTSLLIDNYWSRYIQKTFKIEGRLIHTTLIFSGKITIDIIAIYLPATNFGSDRITKRKILHYINHITSTSKYYFILGDLNEHLYKSPKNGLVKLL